MPEPDHVATVARESARFAELLRLGPLDAPVPSCPGWDGRNLALHLGQVQRWARLAVVTGAPPDASLIDAPTDGGDATGLAAWFDDGAAALVAALAALDPDGPTWHPFPVAQVGRIWPRRQAQEVTVHRWDLEQALGRLTPIAPEEAAAGLDDYFEVIVPRVVDRDGKAMPPVDLVVTCPDAGRTWVVDATGRFPRLADGADEVGAAATITAPAADVLLALWGRHRLPASSLTGGADDWLRFGGN